MRLESLSMTPPFTTAIVPAAGLGTRFLPTTKAVPKELFPVVDTPGIELVAAEAAEAGATRLIIVTSPGKDAVAEYFRPQPELEDTLRRRPPSRSRRSASGTRSAVPSPTCVAMTTRSPCCCRTILCCRPAC